MMRASSGIASPLQPLRVAAAVGLLVMRADPRAHVGQAGVVEHLRAQFGVAADHRELLVVQPRGLLQDAVRNADLADVVQQTRQTHACGARF